MLIQIGDISKVFEKIHKDSLGSGTTIWILVSYDTDSLCAVNILTKILKVESILYKIIPITGYTEMHKVLGQGEEAPELKTIMMINCGAVPDLSTLWFAKEDSRVSTYIFDSHRPIHHNNIPKESKVYVIVDDKQQLEDCPVAEDFEVQSDGESEDFSDLNSSDEEEEEEKDEGSGEEGIASKIGKKRRRKRPTNKKMKKRLKHQRSTFTQNPKPLFIPQNRRSTTTTAGRTSGSLSQA